MNGDHKPEEPLPPLREELLLHVGPPAQDGSPTWTLHDPVSNRFFRIGWQEFEILSRWSLATPTQIATAIGAETTWHPDPSDIIPFVTHLRQNHLLTPYSAADRTRLLRQQTKQANPWRWLLQNALFLRIPLWNPDPFLQRTLPLVRWLFTGWFMGLMVLVALVSLALIVRQWERFTSTFVPFFNLSGMLYYAATLMVSKMVHELGHAYAARLYGCRVPTMGVALLVFWPLFYTDTSDAWTLASRRHRLVIGGAGLLAELTLATLASLAWSFLPDGPLRSATFLLASTVWIVTLTVNLNPLLRFDGYFLLADRLEMADLQQRAFQLGRWQLRAWLFGLGIPPPESFTPPMRRFLVAYALAAWSYRAFIFLGIALLVYHQFFKLLGLLLLALEVGWFLMRPLGQELMTWFALRKAFRWNREIFRTTLLLIVAVTILATPGYWTTPQAPALLQAPNHMVIYAPASAQLTHLLVTSGQQVAQGERLLSLDDPDLNHRLDKTARDILLLRWRLARQTMEREPLEPDPVLQQDLESAQATLHALLDEQKKLSMVAPFEGKVVDLASDLRPGDWVAKDEPLLTVIGGTPPLVKGYVAERDQRGIAVGDTGLFYPDLPNAPPLAGRVLRIDQSPTRSLASPYLASLHGGTIPVREQKSGKQVVEGSYYRLDLALEQTLPVEQMIRGVIILNKAQESLFSRWWQIARAVYRQESGF